MTRWFHLNQTPSVPLAEEDFGNVCVGRSTPKYVRGPFAALQTLLLLPAGWGLVLGRGGTGKGLMNSRKPSRRMALWDAEPASGAQGGNLEHWGPLSPSCSGQSLLTAAPELI